MYFPIIVAVSEREQRIGYLVKWRRLITSPQELEGFSKLIGEKGRLYIGNDDNTVWTDGLKTIPAPPISLGNIQKVITYTGPEGSDVIASAQFVRGTRWIILIALSKQIVTKTTKQFLYAITLIGASLLCLGIILAWLLSRYITTPLKKLTNASNDIASGNYHFKIEVNRKDELGVLAQAFNSTAAEVHNTHQGLEKKVREGTEALQLTNQELETFSYSVSHDLHSPVRKINNYVGIMKKQAANSLTEETQKMLDNIEKNSVRMEQLIDDILNFSQINKENIAIEEINMTNLVQSVIEEQFSASLKTHLITVANLHSAFGDSSLIQQVWINLISNGIKFSQKTSHPCIQINSYKNDREVVYLIKDNGIGFENVYAEKLFAVFQRLHSKSEFEGTGIGLAIAKRVIERHKGRESESENGATFYFSLPKKTI